jgi:hypothetical protein
MQIGAGEKGVVVEHLLKMGHEPTLVDSVAVEAPADLVADAAASHPAQRVRRHLQRQLVLRPVVAAEEPLDGLRLRELGSASPAAMFPVVATEQGLRCPIQYGMLERSRVRCPRRYTQQMPCELVGGVLQPLSVCVPGFSDGAEDVAESRQVEAALAREVGSGVERLGLWRQEDRQRPAPLTGERYGSIHVHCVDIGSFLTIDLDAYEMRVEKPGRSGILEGLVRHYVAPVTG